MLSPSNNWQSQIVLTPFTKGAPSGDAASLAEDRFKKMSETNQQITIGLIQMSCSGNPAANLDKVVQKIREAAQQGAQIICTQELFKSLYFCQDNNPEHFNLAEEIPGKTTQIFDQLAKELGVVLIASLYEKSPTGDYFNTATVHDADGKFLGKYRKLHIPDDLENHYSELYYFKPGDLGAPVFETKFGKIGILVCWDQWYPEPARELAKQGAEIIFYPTAIGWPNTQRAQDIGKAEFDGWVTIQRSHAIANGVFVAVCNRTQTEDHLNFWGGSFVADPFGVILKQASHDHEELIITTIDKSRIQQVRTDWPFLVCRRFEQAIKTQS